LSSWLKASPRKRFSDFTFIHIGWFICAYLLKNEPVETELSTNGSNLYIFFGGLGSEIGMPPFEFYNFSKIINENKIFIRDLAQCWYHDGLPGISNDIYSTAKYIQRQVESLKPKKIFFVGNSMGGYAAILFANLIGKGEVIAFAPQTFISPGLLLNHRNLRWHKQILATYRKSILKRKAWNLKPLLLRRMGSHKISVFVSKNHRIDYIHALHMKDVSGQYVCV